jgi:hypothetical protein
LDSSSATNLERSPSLGSLRSMASGIGVIRTIGQVPTGLSVLCLEGPARADFRSPWVRLPLISIGDRRGGAVSGRMAGPWMPSEAPTEPTGELFEGKEPQQPDSPKTHSWPFPGASAPSGQAAVTAPRRLWPCRRLGPPGKVTRLTSGFHDLEGVLEGIGGECRAGHIPNIFVRVR